MSSPGREREIGGFSGEGGRVIHYVRPEASFNKQVDWKRESYLVASTKQTTITDTEPALPLLLLISPIVQMDRLSLTKYQDAKGQEIAPGP